MQKKRTAIAATCLLGAAWAHAQSNVTLYGTLDQYYNHMTSSSGASINALQDGKDLRSRLGFRGQEDLGAGLAAKFQLEMGLTATTGATADASRGFDRQAWVGLGDARWGEVRLGRQNGPIFTSGGYIDFSSRTLGSVVNAFGAPSRYDNDISYISPRWAGLQLEAHYAKEQAGAGASPVSAPVIQLAADYVNGPWRVGYAGLDAKPAAGSTLDADVFYHSFYGNYDYGRGKVYVAYIRSNNVASSANGSTAAQVLGNVGGSVVWGAGAVNRTFNVYQVSADYLVTPQLRVGALLGRISDASGSGANATGAAIGAYYDLSKRTTVSLMWDTLHNDANAGFRPSGSAALQSNFTGSDVNGKTISGIQLGILHRF